jgi:hypothetical protein
MEGVISVSFQYLIIEAHQIEANDQLRCPQFLDQLSYVLLGVVVILAIGNRATDKPR